MQTHRERMLAAIRGEPTDQIPWAPRMDLWYIAHRARGTLPDGFSGLDIVRVAKKSGIACRAIGADFTLLEEPDLVLRGIGFDNHPDYPYRVELRDLPFEQTREDGRIITVIETIFGRLSTEIYFSNDMKKNGVFNPPIREFAIKTMKDIDTVAEIFNHLEVISAPEAYETFRQRIGSTGVAVARGPNAASPMHLVMHDLMALDQFIYLYTDNRNALYQLAERINPIFEAFLDALCTCSAEVVLWGGNYDQNVTWPSFFAEEIIPWLRKASDQLHSAGKYLLTHTDGEIRALLPNMNNCGIDIAEAICPAPMTKATMREIREALYPEVTIWGGIPSVILLEDAFSDGAFEAYLADLFGSIGLGDRLILGVSDNVPPDAKLDRLERIMEWINEFGPVPIRGQIDSMIASHRK